MMTEYPIELEWEISEERLKALKDSTKNECLKSKNFTVVHATNLQYYLSIFPNGNRDGNRGKSGIFLQVKLGDEKKLEAEYIFSIGSANWSYKMNHTFEKSEGFGFYFYTVHELFDSTKKFIVDGKLTVRFEGIFKLENVTESKTQPDKPKLEATPTFRDLWKIGFEDFAIVADGKEIEVHKNVLASYSTVFDAMFNTKFNEGTENRVEITDFPFEVVEKAIQLCYRQKQVSDFSLEEIVWLLKFADKYDIAMIKKNIEANLSQQITVSNIHEIVKIAEEGNALNLRMKCLDFFVICLLKKEFVPNMELLDSEFFAIAIATISRRNTQTL